MIGSPAQQRILHRRIHSDPTFCIPKDLNNRNRSRVASPVPSDLPTYDENESQPASNIPSISYFQSDECGSYGSSYGSRGDIFDQNKQPKLTLGKATKLESPSRPSVSSEITIIDDSTNASYDNRSSSTMNNDETVFSAGSTSPMDRSVTLSTNDYPTRSN